MVVRFRPISLGDRVQCLDSDRDDKAGEQDSTDTNQNGEEPADHGAGHEVTVADGQAGDEREVERIAPLPPLDQANDEAERPSER